MDGRKALQVLLNLPGRIQEDSSRGGVCQKPRANISTLLGGRCGCGARGRAEFYGSLERTRGTNAKRRHPKSSAGYSGNGTASPSVWDNPESRRSIYEIEKSRQVVPAHQFIYYLTNTRH